MLHLQPRVDLEERRRLAVRVVEKLDRTCAPVGNARQQRPRILVHAPAYGFRQVRRRALLDDLLVPALQRAVPVAEDGDAAHAIAERLYLDVARRRHAALHEQAGIAERAARLALHRREARLEFRCMLAALHADAAPARRALEHDRVADGLRFAQRVVESGEHAAAGQQRHARGLGETPRLVLQSEARQVFGPRADERDAAVLEGPREGGVLAQEAVARVHRVRLGALHDVEQLRDVEIRVGDAAVTERVRLAGHLGVQRAAVRMGVDRRAPDAHGVQRAADAHRDLAAVGDEYLAEHALPRRVRSIPSRQPTWRQTASSIGVGL